MNCFIYYFFYFNLLALKENRKFVLKYPKMNVHQLERITFNPNVMGGKPCIRGLRVTVSTVVGLVAAGHNFDEILNAYPYLELEDIKQALAYKQFVKSRVRILPLQ